MKCFEILLIWVNYLIVFIAAKLAIALFSSMWSECCSCFRECVDVFMLSSFFVTTLIHQLRPYTAMHVYFRFTPSLQQWLMAIMQLFIQVHLFSLSRVDGALFHKLVSTKQYIAYSRMFIEFVTFRKRWSFRLQKTGVGDSWVDIYWRDCNVTNSGFVFTINHKMWSWMLGFKVVTGLSEVQLPSTQMPWMTEKAHSPSPKCDMHHKSVRVYLMSGLSRCSLHWEANKEGASFITNSAECENADMKPSNTVC